VETAIDVAEQEMYQQNRFDFGIRWTTVSLYRQICLVDSQWTVWQSPEVPEPIESGSERTVEA
jgi:hypothetical protein